MRRVFTINHSTTKMPRECAAVGCAQLEIVPSRLPCGRPHRYEFFTRGYRSCIARLSLGWSLVDGRKGLFGWNLRPCQFYKEYIQTDQRTQKYILTPWHPVQRLKFKKGKNLLHRRPSRKRKGNQQKRKMYTQIFSNNELVMNAEEEKGEEENKQNRKRMDMVNTEKRKEKQEVQLLNYQQIPLPCLRNKTKARQKINENNREKSKSRKVNRNSAGLCTNE